MNSYSLNNYSSINGFNSYFLVGVIISKINIFPNKQTFHMCIKILKIKNIKKLLISFSNLKNIII